MKRTSLPYALCLAGLVTVGASTPARACFNGVVFSVDRAARTVERADRLLARGDAARAYRVSRSVRRQLERHARREGSSSRSVHLIARARQITAVAVVRLEGNTPLGSREAQGVVSGRQARSLRWALDHLREVHARRPNNPSAQAHLAEALARFPAHREEARSILLRLAEQDLVPSAFGYATLLGLLDSDRDRELREVSLERCQRMSGERASRICPSPPEREPARARAASAEARRVASR